MRKYIPHCILCHVAGVSEEYCARCLEGINQRKLEVAAAVRGTPRYERTERPSADGIKIIAKAWAFRREAFLRD